MTLRCRALNQPFLQAQLPAFPSQNFRLLLQGIRSEPLASSRLPPPLVTAEMAFLNPALRKNLRDVCVGGQGSKLARRGAACPRRAFRSLDMEAGERGSEVPSGCSFFPIFMLKTHGFRVYE